MSAFLATLATRYLLVMLFFPFSAFDKIMDFKGAVLQAQSITPKPIAVVLILSGLIIEIVMPLAVLTGTADRAAALILASYCIVTALLWKQFWVPGDFWRKGDSQSRLLFWDFLKNFSLAGGFLLLIAGSQTSLQSFLTHPLASTHPYALDATP